MACMTMRALLLAAAMTTVLASPAQAAPQRCRAPQGARMRTLASSSLAVAWEARQSVVACLRSGRPVVVDGDSEDARVRIAGRFVAVVTRRCDDREVGVCFDTRVAVWDLRSRRRVSICSYDDNAGDDVYAELEDLKPRRRGVVAQGRCQSRGLAVVPSRRRTSRGGRDHRPAAAPGRPHRLVDRQHDRRPHLLSPGRGDLIGP